MSRNSTSDGARSRTGTDEFNDSTAMRLRRIAYQARRVGMWWTLALVVLALLAGYLFGRLAGDEPALDAARQIEADLLPLVLDADGIWTSPATDTPSVSEAMVRLHQDDDPSTVVEHGDDWLASYDTVLDRLAAVEVAPVGRPVQRQFLNGVTLSRDAVELLQRAAAVEEGQRRAGLLVEVSRLRLRGEQLVQSGRASVADLGGEGGDDGEVSRLPEVPGFDEPDADANP